MTAPTKPIAIPPGPPPQVPLEVGSVGVSPKILWRLQRDRPVLSHFFRPTYWRSKLDPLLSAGWLPKSAVQVRLTTATARQQRAQRAVGAFSHIHKSRKMKSCRRSTAARFESDWCERGENADLDALIAMLIQRSLRMKSKSSLDGAPAGSVPAYRVLEREKAEILVFLLGANQTALPSRCPYAGAGRHRPAVHNGSRSGIADSAKGAAADRLRAAATNPEHIKHQARKTHRRRFPRQE